MIKMINNSLSCLVESSRDLFGLSTFFVLLFISCDSENASDCFQDTGEITRQEVSVEEFTTITAFENITLVVKQADTQKVEIETGENLRNEVAAVVEDGQLLLIDTNDCNYIRDYGITVVYVTTPNLTSIRSSTGFPIQSDGVLAFESLSLLSESFTDPEAETTDGEFNLELDVSSLSITSNGISYFKLKGSAESLNISIAAGDSRVEADKLIAKRVNVNHRGSNDILVNPQESLTGVLRGTGDLQSYNRPATVEVEELYNGRLIFVE